MSKTKDSVMEAPKSKAKLPPPTPFHVMDVVVKDGQRGKIVYSEYFDPASSEYGKKVTVALIGDISTWSMDDLAEGETVVIGRLVKHVDGTTAVVLGITDDGQIKVQDKRTTEIWDVDGLVLDGNSSELLADKASLVPPEDETVAKVPELKVEVKTLVQELSTVSGHNTAYADRDLARALDDGWVILNISVVTETEGDSNCLSTNLVRVVTLEKRHEVKDPEPEVEVTEAKPVEVAADEPVIWETPEEPTTAASAPVIISVEHPEPELTPVAITFHPPVDVPQRMSFEEALRNPRVTAEEAIAIGNQQVFERGRAVFEGLQNASYGNSASCSRKSDDFQANAASGIHFSGMRRTGVTS